MTCYSRTFPTQLTNNHTLCRYLGGLALRHLLRSVFLKSALLALGPDKMPFSTYHGLWDTDVLYILNLCNLLATQVT